MSPAKKYVTDIQEQLPPEVDSIVQYLTEYQAVDGERTVGISFAALLIKEAGKQFVEYCQKHQSTRTVKPWPSNDVWIGCLFVDDELMLPDKVKISEFLREQYEICTWEPW